MECIPNLCIQCMYNECTMNLYKHLGLTRVKGETKKFLLVNNTNDNILFQMQSI